jgi:hypothetical protein
MRHQIPQELQGDPNWLRNILVTLHQFHYVSMEFERNEELSAATGEPQGEWRVTISAPNPKTGRYTEIVSASEDFLEVIYDAVTEAEQMTDEFWEVRRQQKATALAKLTQEERRLLGVE